MFELVLIFAMYVAGGDPITQREVLRFDTQAECRAAMWWWLEHPQAELPGMDPAFWQLHRPSPNWDCQAPAIS